MPLKVPWNQRFQGFLSERGNQQIHDLDNPKHGGPSHGRQKHQEKRQEEEKTQENRTGCHRNDRFICQET
jgi:hypothetical protein